MTTTTLPDPRALTVQSVKDPAGAARILMELDLAPGVLWSGLVLMAALQAIIFALSDMLVPGPMPLAAIFGSPLRFFAMVVVALSMTVFAIQWAGRAMGGTGSFQDVMVLVIWLQVLRIVVQLAALVLTMTVPLLAALLVLAATGIGIYIMLHFVDQAHRLNSLARAAGVLAASVVAIVIGLTFLLAIVGVQIVGPTGNV